MVEINQKYLPYEIASSEQEGEIQLYEYLQVLSRRKVLIIAFCAACLALTIFYNQISPRIYEARISIVIPPTSKGSLLSGSQITLPGNASLDDKHFNTEVYKINGPFIAARALKILVAKGYFKDKNLPSSADAIEMGQAYAANGPLRGKSFSGTQSPTPGQSSLASESNATSETSISEAQPDSASTREINIKAKSEPANPASRSADEGRLISMIQGSLRVSVIKNTNVVEIYSTHTNPVLAKDIANSVAEAFAQYSKDYTYDLDIESLRYLTDEIEDVRKNLLKSELALNEYLAQHKMLEPALDQQLYVSKRTELENSLVELRNERLDAEVRVKELNKVLRRSVEDVALSEAGTVPSGKMTLLTELRSKIIEAQLKKNELASIVQPNNLEYKAIQNQISSLNASYRDEIKKVIKGLEFEIEVITNKENLVRDFIYALDEATVQKEKQNIQYLVLQRDAESYKWLYQYLLGSVLVAEINAKKSQGSVEISSYATTPYTPVKPRVLLNLILGALAGLIGGVGLAFMIENLDQTINTAEKIEEFSELPLLSILPHLLPEEMVRRQGLIVEHSPQDHFSEGVSRLWGNIRVFMKFKDFRTLIVTSALASEGKTTISANLATIAGNSMKTILLGCDFRKPSMLGIFNIDKKNAGGLNDAIGLLYQHPTEFGAKQLNFGDMHSLVRAQRLSGAIEMAASSSAPLRFIYQNGVFQSSNIAGWKKQNPDAIIEKFLEEKPAIFSENIHTDINLENGFESAGELHTILDKIPSQMLLSEIMDSHAIKGGARGLWILESKRISFSPSELIGSPGMKELIRVLKLHFDLVIIDTPPSIPFADITALSGIADNILLVARSGVVTRKTILRCVNWLKRLNFNVAGYVFNDIQLNRDNYYYYGYYSYRQYKKSGYGKEGGYYYGEEKK